MSGSAGAMELEGYLRQIDRIESEAGDLVEGLTESAGAWRPPGGGWSIAECLAHLNRTGRLYLPALDRAIEQGRERGWLAGRPARPGLLGSLLIRSMEPPARLRMSAPARIRPEPQPPLGAAVAEFLAVQAALRERLEAARGLDLARPRVVSPVNSLLRLKLGVAFGFVLAHERRHLWQAGRVRHQPGFAGG